MLAERFIWGSGGLCAPVRTSQQNEKAFIDTTINYCRTTRTVEELQPERK
jgi:hypothetical protein